MLSLPFLYLVLVFLTYRALKALWVGERTARLLLYHVLLLSSEAVAVELDGRRRGCGNSCSIQSD